MPAAPESRSSPRPPVRLAVAACLAVALLSLGILRALDDPWTGRTGQIVFGKQTSKLSTGERYRGLMRCYFDRGFPEHRDRLTIDDWVRIGLRLSSAGVLVAALLGAATAPLWARWLAGPRRVRPPRQPVPAWSRWVLAGALVVAAAIRLPGLGGTFSFDEQDNARRNFYGYHEFVDPARPAQWVPAGWEDALWENGRGNNPYLFSVLSQGTQALWRLATGAPRDRTSIAALRMPSILFGLGAIAATWWALNTLGLRRAAPWAACLMAAHALAVHHAIEARGYGVCLFLCAVLLGQSWVVLRVGRGRDWALFGLLVFASVHAYPGSLYYVGCLNAFIAATLAWQGWKGRDPASKAGLARWFVANTAAGVCFLWVTSPAIPQAAGFFAEKFPTGGITVDWLVGACVAYATGLLTLFDKAMETPAWTGPTALQWFGGGFLRFWPLALWSYVACPILVALGLGSLWKSKEDRLPAWLLLVAVGSGIVMIAHNAFVTGLALYFWYIIFILPAVLGIEACGLVVVGRALARGMGGAGRAECWTGVLVVVSALWMFWISFPWPGSRNWDDKVGFLARQPNLQGWPTKPGQIPRVEIPRGNSLWVTYRDGYQYRIRDYADRPEAWTAVKDRSLAVYGVGPAVEPSR